MAGGAEHVTDSTACMSIAGWAKVAWRAGEMPTTAWSMASWQPLRAAAGVDTAGWAVEKIEDLASRVVLSLVRITTPAVEEPEHSVEGWLAGRGSIWLPHPSDSSKPPPGW
ncbi:hypothetical protein ACJ73_06488 [Blastomyces percursus]|uniref:Uncharacterized protein n=1 Tax=Blastomyces percursus TaxID=1658174 RepID=A0A1J9R105_9EURO|nr:hypothetical protein ACJ73_06488 [Blastomyces percursus]